VQAFLREEEWIVKKLLVLLGMMALAWPSLADVQIDPSVSAPPPRQLGGDNTRGFLAYDNTGSSVFTSGIRPPRALDDGSFTPGPAAGGNVTADAVQAGFSVSAGVNYDFDMVVKFWDTITPANSPVNTGLLGSFQVTYTNMAPGAWVTGLIDITGIGGIYFPDDNWGCELLFYDKGTQTLSTRATMLFYGGGVTTGSSADVYWRDVDGNGQYDTAESRNFSGAPNLANFYLQLDVPEPASLLLALVGLTLLRRR